MVPDYYAMLGVSPEADRESIEQALARVQPAWSSGTRNPKTKHTCQSFLDQIPALRRALLGDPTARVIYNAELESSLRGERIARLDELQKLVALRAAKGGLTVSDHSLLRAECQRLGLATEDLDRLTEPIPPVPEVVDDDPTDVIGEVLDSATRRQIRVSLEHLRRRDLYHLLDLPRDAAGSEIQARADTARRRWMQKTQVTAEKTAWLEAISYAQSHLGSDSRRKRYDRTLIVEAEESFRDAAQFAIKGVPHLDSATRRFLVEEAASRGISPDRASSLIRLACRSQGVVLDGGQAPPPNGPIRMLRCRVCGAVAVSSSAPEANVPESCSHCSSSLRWDCPSCRRGHRVDEPRCGCGFALEQLEQVARHLEAAQEALRARDYEAARTELRQVLSLAPKNPGAHRGLEKIRERLADIQSARAELDLALAGARLVAARAALDSWARLVDPLDPEVTAARGQITGRLRQAASFCAQGDSLATTDPRAARSHYRQALGIAMDLPEAIQGLRRCPPDAPSELRADGSSLPIRLTWVASPPVGTEAILYRVLRKSGATPAHAGDGVLVAETPETECLDSNATPGKVIGYAVFSRCCGVDSLSGAALKSCLITAEVQNLQAICDRGEVLLTWSAPRGAIGVRVVRKLGSPPLSADDGQLIEALLERAIDRGLDEDRVVHYGVYTVFRVGDGRVAISRGKTIAALPHAPGEIVDGLMASPGSDGRLRLVWRPPGHGQVMILRTPRHLELKVGARLERSRANELNGQWLEAAAPGYAFDPQPPRAGACHYTPLTSWAGMLTVGRGITYSSIPDPSALRAVRLSGKPRVNLRWRWSPQGSVTIVAARIGEYPSGPDDPKSERTRVTEAEYVRLGYHSLTLPPGEQGDWHLAVYAVANVEGKQVISPGLDPTSKTIVPGPHPDVTVSYTLRPPRFPGRRWSVSFKTDPPGRPVPPMALVVHPRTLPLSIEDGTIVDQFPPSRDGATFRIRSRIALGGNRSRLFADPRANPSELQPVRIRHPESGGTRV